MQDYITEQIEQAIQAWSQPQTTNAPITQGSAIDDLRDGGTLSQSLAGYQERQAQIEMAQLVEQAICEEKHALLEAPTGTGKSLSYLIPVVRSGKKAIISTANKALQEQLFYKDVPFCQEYIQPFEAVLLKGKNNYLCLQRFDLERNEGIQVHVQDLTFKRIEKAVDDPAWNGDFETLPFAVSHEIRSHINVDENECARRKCPAYKDCYYYQMREQAQHAQVIITNHDMLLLSIQTGSKLLPGHDIAIIDEAHTLETTATKQFTVQVKATQIFALLRLQRVKSYTSERTREQVREQTETLWDLLSTQFPPNKERIALTEKISAGITLARSIEKLSNQLTYNKPPNLSSEEDELYKRTISRVDNLAEHIHTVSKRENEHFVYYLERKNDQISVAMSPLDIAPALRDTLFSHKTVVCTSATLSTPSKSGPSFDYFQEQTGMDNPEMIVPRILPPIFDYQKQALLYLPDDLPEPAYGKTAAAQQYEQAVASRMQQLVEVSRGRAFLLFSSRHMLNTVAAHIVPNLDGYTILQQGDMPTGELLKQFRASSKAVLLGLKTFWEGVDIAGEALSLVVIDRLPFPPVDDPTIQAKLDYIKHNGQDSFRSWTLPSVTIALKQGIGRLIRSSKDKGVMAILDTRLRTKFYGTQILNCLPPARRTSLIQDVEYFLQQDTRNARKLLTALARENITLVYVSDQPDAMISPPNSTFPIERYLKIVELEKTLRPALQELLNYQQPENS